MASPKKTSQERYQQLSREELDTVRAALTPRVMRYVMRGRHVDTWRVRYFLEIASQGAAMGAEPERIEEAMIQWVTNPNPVSLEQTKVDLTVDALGYDESAKHAGLSAKDLLDLNASIALLGGDAGVVMGNPETFRAIKGAGKERGVDQVLKNVIQQGFGIPDNALDGRKAAQLLDRIAEVQMQGFDDFLGSPEFWDDIRDVERGKLRASDFQSRWSGRDANVDPRARQRIADADRRRREAEGVGEEELRRRAQKKKKKRRVEVGEPIRITGKVRHPVRDEVMVWIDEARTRPWLVLRHYDDGSQDLLTADGDGNLRLCLETYEPILPENPATPVIIRHRLGCFRVPSLGGGKRTPGVTGVD